ncbi:MULTISPECIES: hypothetical protein [Mesobacillus]|uniref:Cbb3-type cytochrome oxidase assembly protein CcoS n=1 Tax=Mesobacillus stamsii TaxID=225347 RepID=A0ABU0FSU3_9BACI|nr:MULTISPECIES: hypothetical protein [Mesobacillus]MDQ0412810.1 hypothetical protein [Mesobacillus stamsii]
MVPGAWILLSVMIAFTASAGIIWAWSKKNGLYDESVKYRMLDED